jgi:tight adherence protein B
MEIVLWIGGTIAILLLVVGVFVTVRSERSLVEERLGRYLEDEPVSADEGEEGEKSSFLTDWISTLVEGTSLGDKISKELARADLKFRPGEYVATQIVAAFVTAILAFIISGGPDTLTPEAESSGKIIPILFAVGGAVGGSRIPQLLVKQAQGRRLRKFSDQLPDMLNLMVNGLRAGFSTMQAMEAVSRELPAPICDEFRRVVQEMQLGIPMEKALENLLRRIPSEDLDLVVTAVNVQREVGGNLAEILETISHTIRERIRIKGEIRALTAQVVYSGSFLAILPVILSLILFAVNRPYMMQFFNPETRTCGIPMLICGGIMIIIGYIVMRKIADIEV